MPNSARRSSARKRPYKRYTQNPTWRMWWAELRENFSFELLGLLLFLLGGGLLLTLLRGGAGSPYGVPWLVQMVGWTAPVVAIGTLITGALLMLHEQLDRVGGHWSIEAIVGMELLLLSLQVGSFLWHTEQVTWVPLLDGLRGGMVGWALGSLLMAGLGRWPAFALVVGGGVVGFYYIVWYTPVIYAIPFVVHAISFRPQAQWRRINEGWAQQLRENIHSTRDWQAEQATRSDPIDAANFVAANRQPADPDERYQSAPRELAHSDSNGSQVQTDVPAQDATEQKKSVRTNGKPKGEPKQETRKNGTRKNSTRKRSKTQSIKALPATSELPSIELLSADLGIYEAVGAEHIQMLIENTLEDFNVPVKVVHVESGPTVTQFGVAPQYLERAGQKRKVRVNRIVSLADDLALALAVPAVRIEAPVPGRPYVGIEVPNTDKVMVSLRGVIESKAYQQEGGRLPLPLGRNTAGAGVVMDLTRAPHMLIAGSTGSGKSVCINTMITGLLMRFGPESLRFIMVDPKMVELPGYNDIPHMLGKVITDVDQVMGALTWLLLQMDDRYQAFKKVGVRNVEAYNALASKKPKKGQEPLEPLPYIVLIIDELADLMMTAADDIERQLCRLAQMARATGIHLIIATQRPSTNVVTGLIKANFPSRIAFAVTSQIDSRVILDGVGAERLLGRGDMLLMRPDVAKLQRIQGCLVTDPEINNVVAFWKTQAPVEDQPRVAPWTGLLDQLDDEDGLIQDAIDAMRDLRSCSTSMLQRKLKIGYPKAARLMEDLEKKGIVGPDMGGGQGREVLLKREEDEDSEEAEAIEEEMF